MPRRLRFTPFAALIACVATTCAQTAIEVPEGGTSVAMQDVGGRPLVELRINGKGPYLFILDTGASHTVIAADVIEELGLKGGRIEELRLSDAAMHNVPFLPFPGLSGLGGDRPPRGVLSAAAFPGYLLTLDYPARKILLRAGELPAADQRRVFQYETNDFLPKVPIRLQGRVHWVHVDSASPGGLMLPRRFLEELKLSSMPVNAGRARTVAGEFPLTAAMLEGTIELGEYSLDVGRVIFSDVRPGPAPGPGNLGYEVLRQFAVTMDSKNRRMRFERR
jgi:hypothetical protein